MPKSQTDQEGDFTEIVRRVVGLYAGDRIGILFNDPPKKSEALWSNAAKEIPEYGDKIRELKSTLDTGARTRSRSHSELPPRAITEFMNLKEEPTGEFLRDVLIARITTPNGKVNTSIDALTEDQIMAQELGINNGWDREQARKLKISPVVTQVLLGNLNLKHRPTNPQKVGE